MTRRKTPTGRLSTFRPRYQNIPIRSGEEPARLSDGVKAAILGTIPPHPALPDAPPLDEAIDLVVFDYSILEMRVAAVMAERDPKPTTCARCATCGRRCDPAHGGCLCKWCATCDGGEE